MSDKFLQGGNAYLAYLIFNFFLIVQIIILTINNTTEFLGTKALQINFLLHPASGQDQL